jgi:hypothetical protein
MTLIPEATIITTNRTTMIPAMNPGSNSKSSNANNQTFKFELALA